MHQFMHPPHTLAQLQQQASEHVQHRNASPWTMVPATNEWGTAITVPLWQVEADQMLTLTQRLKQLGILS